MYLVPHGAMAVRPTRELAPLLRELRLKRKVWWAGWARDTLPLDFNPSLDNPFLVAA